MKLPVRNKQGAYETRSVIQPIEAGSNVYCGICDDVIKFNTQKKKLVCVITSIYKDGSWKDTTQTHLECYEGVEEIKGYPVPPLSEQVEIIPVNSSDSMEQPQ